MTDTSRLRSLLVVGVSTAAILTGVPAFAQSSGAGAGPAIGDIVVTAQRKSESIQDVPVAVSAFSQDTLKAQRLDGGDKLELSVPNVNFSRSNFGGFNFQIRGIGQKVITGGAESGVSVNEDFLPLASNHLADAEFYDVERVEVVRGPQGTLYGRNATGGAVNVITAKPTDRYTASITGEYGNYDSYKTTGFINFPIGDTVAVRLAGFYLKRDGFGTNTVTGNKVDGRDLGSFRSTVSWKPTDNFRAYLQYERFSEDDNRNRVGKQLCVKDPGPTSLAGVALSPTEQGLLSQGCKGNTLYNAAAYGTPNSQGTLGGIYAQQLGLLSGDAYATHPLQSTNLHNIESTIDPIYRVSSNTLHLNMDWDLTNNLTLESVTGYNRSKTFNTEDYNRLVPSATFNASPTPGCYYCLAFGAAYPFVYGAVFPGGVVNDPQLGASSKLRVYDQGDGDSNERTQEFRLISHFKGPLNFTVGAFYNKTRTNTDYYVFFNPLTGLAQLLNTAGLGPYYIDPSSPPSSGGHNYYQSRGTAYLTSTAFFGEAYYDITPSLKLTIGLRQTEDKKKQDNYPIELFVPGSGGFSNIQHLAKNFNATTGRLNLDWTPKLSFTNSTLIYATYSRGYKSGGFNTPCQTVNLSSGSCGYSLTFAPEYIDAYEIGTKNTAMNGRLVLNGDVFYYDYTGYQISTIVAKSSVNSNINAQIYGAELESIFEPVDRLTLNANIGYLHTKVTGGNVLDQANLTQGDPSITLVKASDGSNCVVNTAALASVLATISGLPIGAQQSAILGMCSGNGPTPALYSYGSNVTTANQGGYNVGQGIPVNLSGKELPNSPHFTVSVGAQYVYFMPNNWRATARVDYYWQDSSYARFFNTSSDYLKSWDNVNATLSFDNRPLNLNVQLFIKNAFNKQPLTDAYLTDASSGLFYNTFTLDPRTYGISLTKRF